MALVNPPLSADQRMVLEALTGGAQTTVQIQVRTGVLVAGVTRELRALEKRAPPLVERFVDEDRGEELWRATTAGLEAVGAMEAG